MKIGSGQELLPSMLNRHGVVAGATGSGKTITLKKICEELQKINVPVFISDVKGDISGLANTNKTQFFDVYGKNGTPIKISVMSFGPTLMAKVLSLNEVQSTLLELAFSMTENANQTLKTLDDLSSVIVAMNKNAKVLGEKYGRISKTSLDIIQRNILALKRCGGDKLFGNDTFSIDNLFNGISILHSVELIRTPSLYGALLLHILRTLYQELPEEGDMEKPKLVLMFDEAHLLFTDCPSDLLQQIELTVRLIRSKGVGVFFASQSPLDIPNKILAQLGNRILHSLRAYTPQEVNNVKIIAKSFRTKDEGKTYETILNLGIGEALVSFLDSQGTPNFAEVMKITLPHKDCIGMALQSVKEASIKTTTVEVRKTQEQLKKEAAQEYIRKVNEDYARIQAQRKAQKQASSISFGIFDILGYALLCVVAITCGCLKGAFK